MTRSEWESLCDRCGLCCLYRVQDGKTGKVKLLAVACQYLEINSCWCTIYEDRIHTVPDCIMLAPDKIKFIKKLPLTCAYRSIVEGRDLEWWHPLVSGDFNTVHEAGISMKGKVITEVDAHLSNLEYFTAGK